jgi:hypothetical protein
VLFKNPSSWSPDGRWIVVSQLDPVTAQNVYVLPAPGGPMRLYVAGPTRDIGGPVSPDGRLEAYISDNTGRFQLYVDTFPQPGHRLQVSSDGAMLSWWSRDSRQLLFLADDERTVWRVNNEAGPSTKVGTPVALAVMPPNLLWMDATPDRQKFLVLLPERTGAGSITVVQNWRAALDGKQ